MSTQTKNNSFRSLEQEDIIDIIEAVKDLIYYHDFNKEILPCILQWCFHEYLDKSICEELITEVSSLYEHQETVDKIYDGKLVLTAYRSKLTNLIQREEYEKLSNALTPTTKGAAICDWISDNVNITTNFNTKEVYQITENYNKKGDDTSTSKTIIKAVPKEVVVYDPILLEQPRTFLITWESNLSNKTFTPRGESGGATISEINDYLVESGYSPHPRDVKGAISSVINSFIKEKLAVIKKDIDNPGFYYDINNEKLIIVKYEPYKFKEEKDKMVALNEAVELLEQLRYYFKEHEDLLATVLKWGLLAPFSYAKKQIGKWMPWLYLKGTAGSGKTTLAKISLYLWEEPDTENNIGGSSFDSVARVGRNLSRSCFPIIVNEPAGAFSRKSVVEIIKNCVEQLTARGKYGGKIYRHIPAFAPVIFTANNYLPEDDALRRRFYVMSFSYSMRKTEDEKKDFESKFHVDSPVLSPLKKLRVISDFVMNEIYNNPSLLLDDWQETIDGILLRLYTDLDKEVPEWLRGWAESEDLEDFDNTQREDMRIFFINTLNQERTKAKNNHYDRYVEEGLNDDNRANTGGDFEEVNWNIINKGLVPWMLPKISKRGTKYICFTQGLRKAMSKELEFCNDLKSVSEILGWKYQSVRFGSGAPKMVIKVNFNDFLEFLYPNIEMSEEE